MKERIKKIRKDADLTQEAFGAAIGATRAMIAVYETGRVIPDKSMQMLLCSKFNVNLSWLETGEGSPYQGGIVPELMNALRNAPALLAAFEKIVPRMSVQDWKALNAIVEKAIKEGE